MHLQQTKAESRATGGPQYYFHSLDEAVKDFLRRKGACPVVLQTPCGIAPSPFLAVGRDHKLDSGGCVTAGDVGHDRIQQGKASESIGEAIRRWYGLKQGQDFERIDLQVHFHSKGHFILQPTAVTMRGRARSLQLACDSHPLSFHHVHRSKLWQNQLASRHKADSSAVAWAREQIKRVVEDHQRESASRIHEADLLRAAGALAHLGVGLSSYLTSGYDCKDSTFDFRGYPTYTCPVEVKKRSHGFRYQIERYKPLPRVVVLCVEHDLSNTPEDVDVIELATLWSALRG